MGGCEIVIKNGVCVCVCVRRRGGGVGIEEVEVGYCNPYPAESGHCRKFSRWRGGGGGGVTRSLGGFSFLCSD